MRHRLSDLQHAILNLVLSPMSLGDLSELLKSQGTVIDDPDLKSACARLCRRGLLGHRVRTGPPRTMNIYHPTLEGQKRAMSR